MTVESRQASLYVDLFEELPIGCHELDEEGRIRRVNRKELEMLGRTIEEMRGKFVWEFVRELERPASMKAVRAKLAAKVPSGERDLESGASFCRTFEKKDGTTVPMLIRDLLFYSEQGTVKGILSTLQDISVAEDIERAFQVSDAMHLHLAVPVYVIRKNSALEFTFGNQRFCDEVGMTLDEIKGKTDYDFYPRDLAEKYQNDDRKVFNSGEPWQTIEVHTPLGGSNHDVQVVKRPYEVDSDGKVTEIQIVFWDILEREPILAQLEDAVKEARADYRRIFEGAVIGIFQSTPSGQYLRVNPALVQMFGYDSAESLLAKQIPDLYFDPEKRKEFMVEVTDKGVIKRFEYRIRRADGTPLWISEFARVVRDEKGEIRCYEGFVEDINDRKLVEERADRMEELTTIERTLAFHFQNSLGLDNPAVLQLEIRRILCALTASDGLRAHRAMFFRLVDGMLVGLCAVGPSNIEEAKIYADGVGSGVVTFLKAMEEMHDPAFVHPDRLHNEVLRTVLDPREFGQEIHDLILDGTNRTLDAREQARGAARRFIEQHDITRILAFAVEEQGPQGLLLIDCLYAGRIFDINPSEVMMFAHLIPGLLARSKYVQEKQLLQLQALHGIGGQMQIVEYSIRALRRENLSSSAAESISEIESVVNHVRRTLRRSADMGGRLSLKPRPISIDALISEIAQRNRGVTSFHCETSLQAGDTVVACDPDVLANIFDELINNAYAARRQDQPLIISITSQVCAAAERGGDANLDEERKYVRIIVADNGSGIRDDIRQDLFAPFAKSSERRLSLGLPWARLVLRFQHGDIIASSAGDKGARFEIYLPVVESESPDK
ncbi:MAG: PAS domain S-box protein [Chthoniobacter sp.]|uniref:PAS domain-containing sensor histidine kinase n=1 Tax=Chthoniobacter sp. TaxID=2510640 RepID=UPI0032A2F3CE